MNTFVLLLGPALLSALLALVVKPYQRIVGVVNVGLSLVILLIYATLNAVTKGYFRGRLRAAAALTMILSLLAVISSIRGLG